MLCVQSTKNDEKYIDLEHIISVYSKITFKLFIWYLYFVYNGDYERFPLSDFTSVVKIIDNVKISDEGASALFGLNTRVTSKVSELENLYPQYVTHVDDLIEVVKPLGLTDEYTYLFVQGHTIQDNVVLMFLKPLCKYLTSRKYKEIVDNASNSTELSVETNHYRNQLLDITNVVEVNTEFKHCFLYKEIESDLNNYISKL